MSGEEVWPVCSSDPKGVNPVALGDCVAFSSLHPYVWIHYGYIMDTYVVKRKAASETLGGEPRSSAVRPPPPPL